jgi:hypothetical protein
MIGLQQQGRFPETRRPPFPDLSSSYCILEDRSFWIHNSPELTDVSVGRGLKLVERLE